MAIGALRATGFVGFRQIGPFSSRGATFLSHEPENSPDDLRAQIAELSVRLSAYDEAFEHHPVPMVVFCAQGFRILRANASAQNLYGYSKDQFCALVLTDLFAPDVRAQRPEIVSELCNPISTIGPIPQNGANGQELVVTIISSAAGFKSVDARLMMVFDETARHIAEVALEGSQERFRELFENANDVIFLLDLQGRFIAVNRAAEHLTGYNRDELLGESLDVLIAPDSHSHIQDSIRAHLGGSATQHYELLIVSKVGTVRFLEVSTRISYRRGQPVAIQGIGRDITERKNAQQHLEESSRQLQQRNEELRTALHLAQEATQMKEQFLANTSHELRTPMNGIMGMITLLQETELNTDQHEYASAVSQCAEDLLTIINDLLDVSQVEAGKLAVDQAPFDMHESLRSVVKLLRLRAMSKNLELSFHIDPLLPAINYGDSVRFRQVLTNLIANAIKFTPSGGVHVELSLMPGEVTVGSVERVRCAVVDSGIGVDEGVRSRVFEAFFQADSTNRRRFGGTGLGLTISKQLVELMGGSIGTFNNSPLPGATFWFELPLVPVPTKEAALSS